MVRIAVVGSREFANAELVRECVRAFDSDTTVVSGGAAGVDTIAETEANHLFAIGKLLVPPMIFPAKWGKFGKSAGFRRNLIIVQNSDKVIAFWDGKSKGTMNTIGHAKHLNIPYMVFGEDGKQINV